MQLPEYERTELGQRFGKTVQVLLALTGAQQYPFHSLFLIEQRHAQQRVPHHPGGQKTQLMQTGIQVTEAHHAVLA